jgi:hypothetical protein
LFVTAIVVLAIVLWRIGYQNPLTKQIKQSLEAKGITVESLKLDKFGAEEAVFSDIKLGTEQLFSLKNLTAKYTPSGLFAGYLQSISANSADIKLYTADGKWQVGGLETLAQSESKAGTQKLFDNVQIKQQLPQEINVNQANISIAEPNWSLDTSVNLSYNAEPSPNVRLTGNSLSLHAKPYRISTGAIDAKASLADNKWAGNLTVEGIFIEGVGDDALPPFKLDSKFSADEENFSASFSLKDSENTRKAVIEINFPVNNPKSGNLIIKEAKFPWGGGVILAKSITIPLTMDKPLPILIEVQNVDLTALLGKISGDKITGTGKISGTLPLTYFPDSSITLQEGTAQALEAGIISVPPSMLPGDNQQLSVARAALENFHYTSLKIGVYSGENNKSVIQLSLQGNNPDALEGRPVNLNVNLAGDVMQLLQQSLLPFNDFKKLLEVKSTE